MEFSSRSKQLSVTAISLGLKTGQRMQKSWLSDQNHSKEVSASPKRLDLILKFGVANQKCTATNSLINYVTTAIATIINDNSSISYNQESPQTPGISLCCRNLFQVLEISSRPSSKEALAKLRECCNLVIETAGDSSSQCLMLTVHVRNLL